MKQYKVNYLDVYNHRSGKAEQYGKDGVRWRAFTLVVIFCAILTRIIIEL